MREDCGFWIRWGTFARIGGGEAKASWNEGGATSERTICCSKVTVMRVSLHLFGLGSAEGQMKGSLIDTFHRSYCGCQPLRLRNL